MSMMIVEYQTRSELQHAHPEIKNFALAYQVQRGQTHEDVLAALRLKNQHGRFYRVGNFVWQAAQTTPPLPCQASPSAPLV